MDSSGTSNDVSLAINHLMSFGSSSDVDEVSGMTGLARSPLLLALGVLCFGCTAMVDADRLQCTTNADCTARGEEFANTMCVKNFCETIDAWSCAKHPTLVAKSSKSVTIDFALFDVVTMNVVSGASAALCQKLDVACSNPMSKTTTGADGAVHFDVPPLFDGYVQLNAEGYDPTMMFLPPVIDSVDLGAFPFTSLVASAALGGALGAPVDPKAGRILSTITGCDMKGAGGVSLVGEDMGEAAVVFYAVDNFPSLTASSTDASGFCGYVNVTPGSVTLKAELENGREIAQVALFVRAGYVSVRRIQPWTD